MQIHESFDEALENHKKLFLLWTVSLVVLLVSNSLISTSSTLALTLFMTGAVLLAAAGITCAYAVVKEAA